jgi:photosystem II stability/assembly factor-like uncharacterized protein
MMVVLVVHLASCSGGDDGNGPPPTATRTTPATATRTPSVAASATATSTATSTPTRSSSAGATATHTATPPATPTETATTLRFEQRSALDAPGQAIAAAGNRLFAASGSSVLVSEDGGEVWQPTPSNGLPRGHVNALAALNTEPPILLAHVWGKGLCRSIDAGETWTRLEPQLAAPILQALNPRAPAVPFDIAVDDADPMHVVLAAPGGLYRSHDGGATWTTLAVSSPGKVNLILVGAAVRGSRLFAVSQNPVSIIPPAFADLIEGGVFTSDDDGETWRKVTGDLAASAFSDVEIAGDGTVYLTALDGGLFRGEADGVWTALGGPEDALEVSSTGDGVSVASASRGVWRLEEGVWTQAGNGPTASLAGDVALTHDGAVYALAPGGVAPTPAPAGGTVHVALSFHTNLYHSFRGDSNDDNGFGKDIRVIRNTLDWLDRFPNVHGDWDIENAFSLDDLLPRYAPDIIERIGVRLASGQDGLRLMSWNNGAVASEARDEFAVSVERAKQSYVDTFGAFDPGVQPQENMFSPDHVGWYREHGIEWITLFNSATPFTGFPPDLTLNGRALYNPVTLADGDDEIVLVPVYHHADMLDHGGMRAWVRQISATIEGDTLLVIHMDADSDFWLKFDLELEALRDEPAVRFTTIQDYLDAHGPVGRVSLPGDLADGVGDGFASWAEKLFNHEISTAIVRAREDASWASFLSDDAGVADLVSDALDKRVLALSTTHFGLASPFVNPDRVETARQRTAEAVAAASAALAEAEARVAVEPGTIQLVNGRTSAGRALVEIPLSIPAALYAGTAGVVLRDSGGSELPAEIEVVDDTADPVLLQASTVVALQGRGAHRLTWGYDPNRPAAELPAPAVLIAPLGTPFTECDGVRAAATLLGSDDAVSGVLRTVARNRYSLPFCDGSGSLTHTLAAYDGLPGLLVEVDAQMGTASERLRAESVALSPLVCSGDLQDVSWPTFGGRVRTRPARRNQETWNGQSADGWSAFRCDDGRLIQIAHRVRERTSLAFTPLRNDQGQAVIAPLGTLWGDAPWHDSRRIGGIGLGDLATGLVGSQFRPAAPDWSGQSVRYRLLVGDDIDEGTLDLFAHPPLVRVGALTR